LPKRCGEVSGGQRAAWQAANGAICPAFVGEASVRAQPAPVCQAGFALVLGFKILV